MGEGGHSHYPEANYSEIKKKYEKTKTIGTADFSTLRTKMETALETLTTNVGTTIYELGFPDTWDDEISAKINGEMKTGIEGMISSCQSPADQILQSLDGNVETMNKAFKDFLDTVVKYDDNIDDWNDLGPKPHRIYEEDNVTETLASINRRQEWENTNGGYEANESALSTALSQYKEYCEACIEIVEGLLAAIGSEQSNKALELSAGKVVKGDGKPSDYSKKEYPDNYTVDANVVTDPNGNPISATYTIYDENGNIVEVGEVTYDSEGRVSHTETKYTPKPLMTVEEYQEKYGVTEAEAICPDAAQLALTGVPENDELAPESVTVEESTEYADNGQSAVTTSHMHAEYDNDAEADIDKVTQKLVTPTGEEIPISSEADIKITLSDGTVLEGEQVAQYWADGSVRESTTVITDLEGNIIWQAETTSGESMYGRQTVDNTVADNGQGGTTETFERTSGEGDYQWTETRSIETQEDPNASVPGHSQVGTYTDEEGTRYTQYRGEDGKLYQTESYEDKNGKTVTSEPREVPDSPSDYVTVYRTEPDGKVTTMQVNPNSELDMARLRNEMSVDYSHNYTGETMFGRDVMLLFDDRYGTVTVGEPVLSDDPGYVYSTRPPEGYGGN